MSEPKTYDPTDVGYAIFGLGSFIDYRLDGGMSVDDLAPYMAAYLKLMAQQVGREPPHDAEQRVRKVAAAQRRPQGCHLWSPSWLTDDERSLLGLPSLSTLQSTCDPHAPAEPGPSAAPGDVTPPR